MGLLPHALLDTFAAWAPPRPWWPAFVYAVLLYGGRYLVLAGLAWTLARRGRLGRPHDPGWPAGRDSAVHLRREIGHSLVTVGVFGAVNAVLFGWGLLAHSQLYLRIGQHGWAWFVASIVLMLVLHDTLFYWMHRAMHSRALYRATHLTHHRSVQPTAWAAYSFHPWEALLEALAVALLIFLIPIHPLAFLVFQTLSTAYNVYGHCGRELYPPGWSEHPLGRWLNTATAHAHHHARGAGNYSLYFLFWDRWMGTWQPPRPVPSSP